MVAMHAGDGHAGDGHASPSMHVEDRNLSWKYVAQIAGNGVSGLQIFQGSMPLDSLVKLSEDQQPRCIEEACVVTCY